jgi:nucleoside-diphosphate-sugar epimerase
MTDEQARHANVDAVRDIVQLARLLPELRRIVHVSGYRVGGQDPNAVPWPEERSRATYLQLGAYEASKVESDATFQHDAEQAGLRWTVVNPSTVSGVARTGDSDQFIGLAGTLHELWRGTLSALPGNASTVVPVVPVDHLAQFMTELVVDADSVGQSYWVLDDTTPPLHELLRIVGDHYRVRVPTLRLPIAVIKRLPRSVTKADPETSRSCPPTRTRPFPPRGWHSDTGSRRSRALRACWHGPTVWLLNASARPARLTCAAASERTRASGRTSSGRPTATASCCPACL